MTKIALFGALFSLAAASIIAEDKSVAQQIAEAVAPLPSELQADATVIRYSSPDKKTVLREGTSHIVCSADSPFPGFSVMCYPKSLQEYRDRMEVHWEKSEDEYGDALNAEIKEGKFEIPERAVHYVIRGAEFQNALPLTIVYLPNATFESTGLSTTPSHYRPWLMFAGTPMAHIMVPGK
jgi:hypothetical protein